MIGRSVSCPSLVAYEGETWGLHASVRGASERLIRVLMTAMVTALGLLPLALSARDPGKEIEGPIGGHNPRRPRHLDCSESACAADGRCALWQVRALVSERLSRSQPPRAALSRCLSDPPRAA